jgi:predicted Fe-S protein YdhL (DUF1289 family)
MGFDHEAMLFIAATSENIRGGCKKYAQALPSPCMSVCQMDEVTGLCKGCLRTLAELTAWGNADETFKRQVWMNIEARVAPLLKASADDFFDAAS